MNRRGPNRPETIVIYSLESTSTINHDFLPAVGEELHTNGQYTATYTNRLQFALKTTVTHSIGGSAKVKLNNIRLHYCI